MSSEEFRGMAPILNQPLSTPRLDEERGPPNLAKLAPKVGMAMTVFIIIMGFVAFFGKDNTVAAYTFIVGLSIAPIEVPIVCNKCWPWVQEVMLMSFNMNNWLLRGVMYVLLTFVMFLGDEVTILAGIGLSFTGIVYIVAHAQGLREPEPLGNEKLHLAQHTPATTFIQP